MSYELLDAPPRWRTPHVTSDAPTTFFTADPKLSSKDPATIASEDPSALEPSGFTSKWTIGWRTPTLIASFYVLAGTLAVAHLIIFRYLDSRRVDQTIAQSYVANISTAFVTLFRICLVASLVLCFTQMLWRKLRTHPMRLHTIDNLFSAPSNPLNILDVAVLWNAPFLCLCIVVCWCISVAMIYPPGALIVESRQYNTTRNVEVPTFDPTYRGNGTYADLKAQALFEFDQFDNYQAPSIDLSRIGKETIISGKYLTFPSPCGQNCSYTINIEGPGFNCTDALPSQFQQTVNMSYPMPNREPYNWTLYAAVSSEVSSDPAQGEGGYTFDVQWADKDVELEQPTDVHNISCLAYKANYTLDISYHNGLATIIAQQRLLDVLNSSYQGDDYSYNPETPKGVNPNTSEYDFIINSTSCENAWLIEDLYKRSTLLAVRDTLVDTLIGIIGVPDFHSQRVVNTLIRESALATYPPGINSQYPVFDISASSLQSLLQNITISMLTLQRNTNTNISVPALQNISQNFYAFAYPRSLFLPYFLSLLVGTIFVAAGFSALQKNGVSATSGGILQTMCTTRGNPRLDRIALGGCLGGRENVPKALGELEILFGELEGKRDEGVVEQDERIRRAGFGTVEEVRPLRKGLIYGGGQLL